MRPHITFPGGERPEVQVSGSLRRILSRTELPFLQENRSQSWSSSGRIFRGDGDRIGYRGRPLKNHCEDVDLPFPHVQPGPAFPRGLLASFTVGVVLIAPVSEQVALAS